MKSSSRFAVRGFTMQELPKGRYPFELVDWMAEHGLNRLEIQFCGKKGFPWPIPDYPELTATDATADVARFRRLVHYGRRVGVRIAPAIAHADSLRFITAQHPEWRAKGKILHPTGTDLNRSNICFAHPGVAAMYKAAVTSLVRETDADEVQFWLTENRLWCSCARCRQDNAGEDNERVKSCFIKQARLFHDSIEHARKIKPDLEISLWTTQGSRHINDALIRSLPRETLWFYYDGERRGCYNLRRTKTIPENIRRLRKRGYRVAVQLDWASCGAFLTVLGRIRETCMEALSARLEGVCGWIDAYPLNGARELGGGHPVLTYSAAAFQEDVLRNPRGIRDAMAAAAVAAGHSPRIAQAAGRAWQVIDREARRIYLCDRYSYWWHGCSTLGAVCERIIRGAAVDEIDQRWADDAWDVALPKLDKSLRSLAGTLSDLESLNDRSGYLTHVENQIRLIAAWGHVCRWILWAGIVYTRMGGWDTCHGPWSDDKKELLRALGNAGAHLKSVKSLWRFGHKLPGAARWHWKTQIRALKDQLRLATKSALEGASPQPLPRQDAYPYANVAG